VIVRAFALEFYGMRMSSFSKNKKKNKSLCIFLEMMSGEQKIPHLCNDRIAAAFSN
jgi:hypothetical protein